MILLIGIQNKLAVVPMFHFFFPFPLLVSRFPFPVDKMIKNWHQFLQQLLCKEEELTFIKTKRNQMTVTFKFTGKGFRKTQNAFREKFLRGHHSFLET